MVDEEFIVSEETLMCAVDYALGRKSYVVDSVVGDVLTNAESLSDKARRTIIESIEKKFQLNELGQADDKKKWVELLRQLSEIENERG